MDFKRIGKNVGAFVLALSFSTLIGCAVSQFGNGGMVVRWGTEVYIGTKAEISTPEQKSSSSFQCDSLVGWLFPTPALGGEALLPVEQPAVELIPEPG